MESHCEKFCKKFDAVMDLKKYDSTKHDDVFDRIDLLILKTNNSKLPQMTKIKILRQINKLKVAYTAYYKKIEIEESVPEDEAKCCSLEYSEFKKLIESELKVETCDKDSEKTNEGVLDNNNSSSEFSNDQDEENVKLRKEIAELKEYKESAEKEIENLKKMVHKHESDNEELYKKYANENAEKNHIKNVFDFYIKSVNLKNKQINKLITDFNEI